jgi:large repetitive protein
MGSRRTPAGSVVGWSFRPGGGAALALAVACSTACGPTVGGDPPDASVPTGEVDGPPRDGPPLPPDSAVFANTEKALYRVDSDTLEIAKVADFGGAFPTTDSMTDLAVDSTGRMIGISFDQVFRIDPMTAAATLVGDKTLLEAFNGLSFVPSILALGVPGADVLVATRSADGRVFQIDAGTGVVSQLGDMGAYTSSGDVVAVYGFGMVATVSGATQDTLVQLAPRTFAATPIGTGTGFSNLWGLGYWKNRLYGFSSDGIFVDLDPTTGAGTQLRTSAERWWGAAVTTAAPSRP